MEVRAGAPAAKKLRIVGPERVEVMAGTEEGSATGGHEEEVEEVVVGELKEENVSEVSKTKVCFR